MSSPAALATVTATLQHLLTSVTATVTTQPPSMARNGSGDQINIFLYSTHYNTAFSNAPMPGETRSGENAYPPLPLVLKYLITAYGANDEDISGQQLMGEAMSVLHDHPLLGPSDFDGITPDSKLQQQIERVRITPDTLSLDDMSKLWTSFQSAEYRLSTGYEVSVLLIESSRPGRTPLPVLKRGADDRGPDVVAGSPASLSGFRFPNQKPSAELGDVVTLLGTQLSNNNTQFRFQHTQLENPIEIQPETSQQPRGHDHPLLGPSDFDGITPDSKLQQQIERVRITPDTLSLDDMSKLWTSFQSAEYRLSTGYEVSVLLIESSRPGRTPLPVLKRGADDRGPDVVAGSPASLSGFRFPNQKPSAELGDVVTLLGTQLSNNNTQFRFQHTQLENPIEIQPETSQQPGEMAVQLPAPADDAALGSKWLAGFYTVSLVTDRPGVQAWTSNSIAMPLSPNIESIVPTTAPAGNLVVTIECLPQIKEQQSVSLLFGDRIIKPDSVITPADPTVLTTLTFTIEDAIARVTPYVLRLRVDGVDSIPVDFLGNTPQFASNQMVTVT